MAGQGAADRGVDWNQIITGLGSAYGTYRGKTGLDTSGTYGSQKAMTAASPYASSTSRTAGGRYLPRAEVVI